MECSFNPPLRHKPHKYSGQSQQHTRKLEHVVDTL
jgi:hypothetical protein